MLALLLFYASKNIDLPNRVMVVGCILTTIHTVYITYSIDCFIYTAAVYCHSHYPVVAVWSEGIHDGRRHNNFSTYIIFKRIILYAYFRRRPNDIRFLTVVLYISDERYRNNNYNINYNYNNNDYNNMNI